MAHRTIYPIESERFQVQEVRDYPKRPCGSLIDEIDRSSDGGSKPSNLREMGHSWAQTQETTAGRFQKTQGIGGY